MTSHPHRYEFTVDGSGVFPFDMLRYDHCWPQREADSAEITRTTQPRERTPATVKLIGLKRPNEGRWKSFGWTVSEVQ